MEGSGKTYRERREARADRREDWADSRRRKAGEANARADQLSERFAMGQPILVGHHSEKGARRDQERMHGALRKTVEHHDMAKRHDEAADTIRRQLDTSIYRDDVDELERLEAKVEKLEAKRARIKAVNRWFQSNRKRHGFAKRFVGWGETATNREPFAALMKDAQTALELTAEEVADLSAGYDFQGSIGYPSYALQNLGGTINRTKKRIPAARKRAEDRARVAEALRVDADSPCGCRHGCTCGAP